MFVFRKKIAKISSFYLCINLSLDFDRISLARLSFANFGDVAVFKSFHTMWHHDKTFCSKITVNYGSLAITFIYFLESQYFSKPNTLVFVTREKTVTSVWKSSGSKSVTVPQQLNCFFYTFNFYGFSRLLFYHKLMISYNLISFLFY